MRVRFWLPELLALPLLVVALVYGRNITRCQQTASASATTDDSDKSECCSSDKSQCCLQENETNASKQTAVQGSDPDKQIVFKVEGLRCPAVKGIGCGHMLHPVLAALDKIDGVEASSSNYTGTMIRVSVTDATDRTKVADAARKALAENEPVALADDELRHALEKEQWRGTARIGELSAIEFRELAHYQIRTFAQAEKLDRETTDKLTKMAQEQWEQVARAAKKEGATQPEDWGRRCKQSMPAMLARAKEVLSEDQLARLKKALTTPCPGNDRPEAPPAPGNTP
jgi:hypothetical protein